MAAMNRGVSAHPVYLLNVRLTTRYLEAKFSAAMQM